jgi:hypothetical protein
MARNYSIKPAAVNFRTKRNIVRVSVPAKAYYDLDSIQKIQRDILGELGCLACCSGWDIRFDMQRNFVIDR